VSHEARLRELDITLPVVPPPAGTFVHAVRTGNLIFLTGRVPFRTELGSLDRARRIVKVNGVVSATPEFMLHTQAINGASDLFVSVFGDAGVHARLVVGDSSLPFNICLEVEVIAEVAD
jgi:enamine deaminase RidA (YjgF/YER057c/UK114 family)